MIIYKHCLKILKKNNSGYEIRHFPFLDLGEIRLVLDELNSYVTLSSGRLVRQLKRRDKNAYK